MSVTRQFREPELVIATHNAGKADEIAELLQPYVTSFFNAKELGLPEPEETKKTFIGNATLKAVSAMRHSGKAALADDSGLFVNALDGAPGIYSARWAEDEHGVRDFNRAMSRVNEELADVRDRSAAFICALSLAWPDGHVESFEGCVKGRIIFEPRGDKGFGYDPIFMPNGYNLSFAEMDPAVKQQISHRRDAFDQLVKACFCQ